MRRVRDTYHLAKQPGRQILVCLLLCFMSLSVFGQQTQKLSPQYARGNLIQEVTIFIMDDSLKTIATLAEKEAFYKAFFIKPGTTFDPLITDLAISRIIQEPNVQNAWYELFNAGSGDATINSSLTLNLYVEMKNGGKESSEEKGIFSSKNISDFPLLYQSGNTQFKFLLNGGLGLFNDENAFFGEGPAFTQGNSIATEPAQKGNKFWLEAFVEPGISGITKLGKSKTYIQQERIILRRIK